MIKFLVISLRICSGPGKRHFPEKACCYNNNENLEFKWLLNGILNKTIVLQYYLVQNSTVAASKEQKCFLFSEVNKVNLDNCGKLKLQKMALREQKVHKASFETAAMISGKH